MSTTSLNPIDVVKDTVNKNSLCYSVGKEMFCRYCDELMDWRRSVEVSAWKGHQCDGIMVMCCKCWDKAKGTVLPGMESRGFRVDVIDGRELLRKGIR